MTALYPTRRFGPPRPCPELATARLTLGPMTIGDWPDYWTMMSSDRARFMGGPLEADKAWGWFCADIAGWTLTGAGALAILKDGATVGQISLNDKPYFPEPELGWTLYAGHEGQGYVTEAAAAVRDWLRAEHRPATLVSYCSAGNGASIAVARRLGATEDPAAPRPDPDDLVLRHWGSA